MTGNIMGALAIQLPDMLAGFGGLAPAIAGAALGLGAALIPALLRTEEKIDDTTDAMAGFNRQISAFKGASEIALTELPELEAKFGRFAESIRNNTGVVMTAAIASALRKARQVIKDNDGMFDDYNMALRNFASVSRDAAQVQEEFGDRTEENAAIYEQVDAALADARDQLDRTSKEMGLTATQAYALKTAFERISEAQSMDEIASSAEEIKTIIAGMNFEAGNMPEVFALLIPLMNELSLGAAEAATQTDDMAEDLTTSADEAERLRNRIAEINRLNLQASKVYSGRGGDPSDFDSGIGDQSDEIQKIIDAFNRGQQTIGTRMEEAFDASDAFGSWFDDLDRIEDRTNEAFDNMVTAMSSGTKKMQKIAQGFSAARAFYKSYEAAADVLADPMLPWWAKAAQAAATLATGLSFVNAIKGGGGGGGGGGGAASVPSSAPAIAQAPLQVSLAGLNADQLYEGGGIGRLLDRLNDEAGDRGYRILGVA